MATIQSVVDTIHKQLTIMCECGETRDDIQVLLDKCQLLNRHLQNRGLTLLTDEMSHYLQYDSELDVLVFMEKNDIVRRIRYYCQL